MATTSPQPSGEESPPLPPLRSLSDFLTDARFTAPTINEPKRMRDRMYQNLLYYQTNYLVFYLLALFATCTVCPAHFIRGGLLVLSATAGLIYARKNQDIVTQINRKSPLLGVALALMLGLLLLHFAGKMLIFMAGTTFPLLGCLMHAACRMRNIANKVNNLKEMAGLSKSPMGVLLEYLGVVTIPRAVIDEFHQAASDFTY